MDTINIIESIDNRIAELEAEQDMLSEARDALVGSTTTTEKVVKVTDKPTSDTDDARERMLANLEKARAVRQANLAAARKGNTKKGGKKSGNTRTNLAKKVADGDMNMAETITFLTDQGLTVAEIVEETGAHPSYVYTVRRNNLANVA